MPQEAGKVNRRAAPATVRLRDRVREWMAQMAEIRQREKGVLDTMSETVANLRESCDLIWRGAVDASAANREVIGRTYKPERILEPAVVVNVEKTSEWLRGWREVIQELRGVGGGDGEEGDEDE